LIRVVIVFNNGHPLTIAKGSARATVSATEEILWKHMSRIANVQVVARGPDVMEGARIQAYLKMIQLDIQLDRVIDRDGIQAFDIYEIAKHPRRVP
jgi:hypothetical protein